MTMRLATSAYGDSGLLVVPDPTADAPADAVWVCAHRLTRWLLGSGAPGVLDAVPTYDRVLVEFDPVRTDHATVAAFVRVWAELAGDAALTPIPPRHTYRIPVLYGGEGGPDLARAAADLGVDAAALVDAHLGLHHAVRCLAQAGSPMLDGIDLPGEVARRTDPRIAVPAGAVMLAGRQSMIMTVESPSGWQVIGRTPARLVDPAAEEVVDHRPGDLFTYEWIDAGEWDELAGRPLREFRV